MGICAHHSKAMDAKDLRTESTISERCNNGSSKFAQGGAAPPCNASKTYENVSANPLAKLEAPTSRPCAVIGPDRIVPPSSGDAYSKKGHYEPWLHVDNTYHQPPEYPHKIPSYQSPIRNISPRQTFQENMQRIMVQPNYNSVKLNDDPNYTLDRNTTKNSKISGPQEAKYCDVPYSVNPMSSDQKQNEMCVTNINNSRNYPQMWHPAGVPIRPTRPYGAPDLYQFPEYASCAGPRPMQMARPHRTINEDPSHAYSEPYYPEGNLRFKPYPTVKERYPQARYEYLSNYANPFHPPPPFPSHKYDLQKPLPPHVTYPQVPIKYLENRMTENMMDGYHRPQTVNYNVPYRNPVIHPTYGPMIGSNLQNKAYPYPPDGPVKSLASNKLPYDSKLYAEYENARAKGYPMSDSVYLNEIVRPHIKNQPVLPNYPTANMQAIHAHPYYRKDNLAAKNYEYISHLRHLDPSMNPNALSRLSTQFSPNSIAISPSDSNTSNETSHTHGGSLEDCGYVSQSSTTSIRSFNSVNGIMPNDYHQRYNYPYQTMVRTSPLSSKPDGNSTANSSKDKKSIDVRQFLQMWNEGEEENGGKEKEVVIQSDFNSNKLANQYEAMKNHEQLYVLGLVNVPSEELGKYEHIQKISKLPENIKGYNNIELLKHFEEAIESSNISNSNQKQPLLRNYHSSIKSSLVQGTGLLPSRPISPLDVEAKISQSVIHKEVGCNFEIKPCSPEMLNAEVATTAQSILGEERVIEKVSNPMIKSPILNSTSESEKISDTLNQKEHRIMLKEDVNKSPSCKMINTQCSNNEGVNVAKANYSLQDLESNAGICLASLPRLDNDIELNFPEVNQQFINANKESVIKSNDFTNELDAIPNDDNFKSDEILISKSENTSSVMPIFDLEKEVSKLSKYRKIKRNDMEYKENQILSVAQSMRTDSVIIKNPENTKCLEKNTNTSPPENKTNENQLENHELINNDLVCDNLIDNKTDNINREDTNDMAIDFSFSRVENNHIDKHSKYLCEVYSERNPYSSPGNLSTDKPEDKNSTSNLLSDSKNDITMKKDNIDMSDEANYINLCHESENIDKCIDEKCEKLDIKECDDILQPNVVECPENISEILSDTVNIDTDSLKTVSESTADQINAMDHDCNNEKSEDNVDNKSNKPTTEEKEMDTQLLDSATVINKTKISNATNSLSDNLPAVFKARGQNDEINNTILHKDAEDVHCADVFYNNLNMKNNLPINECIPTVIEFDSAKNEGDYSENKETYNDAMESDDLDKSILCEVVKNKHSKVDSVVKINGLRKELFSPQIQKLMLCSEGQSGLVNKYEISNPVTDSNVNISTGTDLNKVFTYSENQYRVTGSDSEGQVNNVDNFNSVENCTNVDLKSETNYNCPVSVSDAEVITEANMSNVMLKSVSEASNVCVLKNDDGIVKNQSKSDMLKDFPDDDLNIENSSVNNLHSFTDNNNSRPQSESTIVKDFPISESDVEISSSDTCGQQLDNNVQVYASSNLLSEDSYAKSCEILDSNVKISGEDSLISVKDIAKSEFLSESTDIKALSIIGSDVDTSAVNTLKGVKDGSNSENRSECETNEAKSDADSLNFVPDCANSALQSKCINVKDCPILGSDAGSIRDRVDSRLQSETTNPKDISDSSEDTSGDDSDMDNSNNEIQSESADVNDCSESDEEKSSVEKNSNVQDCANSKLRVQSTDNKESEISDTTEISSVNNQNSVIYCANSELQSESSDPVKSCSIIGSDIETPNVINLNCCMDSLNSKLQSESLGVRDCLISDSEIESSEAGSFKSVNDLNNSKPDLESTIFEDCHTPDSHMSISGPGYLNIFDSNELQSESTPVKDYPIPDSGVGKISLNNLNSIKDCNELQSKADSKKSISHVVKSNLKNVAEKKSKLNDVDITHVNHHTNTNIQETEEKDGALIEVEPSSDDSGVRDIENDSSIFEEQVSESKDPNICNEHRGREVDQIKTTDEGLEIITPSNTKPSFVRRVLKRSLSDSALNFHSNDKSENIFQEDVQLHNFIAAKKRRKINDLTNICETHFSTTDMLNIHNNRRNSISSIYNEENMAFCIVIDNNCIITEENEEGEKVCYTEIPEECLTGIHTDNFDNDAVEPGSEIILCPQENSNEYNEPLVLEISDEKTLEESWVDDVACVETVVSDDIAEDIELSAPSSPTEIDEQENDESGIFTSVSEHTEKVKYIYGDKMCNDDAELVETLYRTPQMDVNKTLINRESHVTDDDDDEFLEGNEINNVHPEAHGQIPLVQKSEMDNTLDFKRIDYNNISNDDMETLDAANCSPGPGHDILPADDKKIETDNFSTISCGVSQDNSINSCESSVDEGFTYNQDENSTSCPVFSSPEVSSTTPEERNTSLLLKITNYQGTRTSQLNDLILTKTKSCKFTENINYTNFISNSAEPRPLITKAAQKYIPPLKETVDDLKVKLPLPHDSLMKFKQLKMAKAGVRHNPIPKKDTPKKPKPKFEDVLKSIDEIQFKMHREKSKKPKKSVPKVVIKKTENGSHYASTPNRDCFNPDLTGRKWQPWVLIEKSTFIDKMALRRKTKAIYNHRKNTYVFADKFKKYKSMSSAKFVITQPKLDDPTVGKLKYTIRLKHSY